MRALDALLFGGLQVRESTVQHSQHVLKLNQQLDRKMRENHDLQTQLADYENAMVLDWESMQYLFKDYEYDYYVPGVVHVRL